MKTLLLLRHGKASRDDAELADHERPLLERGKQAAKHVGRFLRDEKLLPDLIVSSTALRARKTAQKTARSSEYPGAVELEERLYMADPKRYSEVVRGLKPDADRVLLVGHNPGMSDFLNQLTGADEDLPTAGLAVIGLPIQRWKDLTAKTRGRLIQVRRARESK